MNNYNNFIKKVSQISLCFMAIILLSAFSPQEIQSKSAESLRLLKQHAEAGDDVSKIIPKMQQVEKLGKAGKFKAADELINEVLEDFSTLNKIPSSIKSNDISPSQIQKKSSKALLLLKKHAEAGGDVSKIIPKMQQVEKLGKAGNLTSANALLDEILDDFAALEKQADANDKAGPFINAKQVKIEGYDGEAAEPFISHDSKYLFFNDHANQGENRDLHWAVRKSDTVFHYKGRIKNVNSSAVDGVPSMDNKGRFYYISTNNYNAEHKFSTIYSGDFNPKTGAVENITPHTELSLNKPGWLSMDVEISPNGQWLYGTYNLFSSKTKGPQKSYLFSARKKKDGTFAIHKTSKKEFKNINKSGHVVYAPNIAKGRKTLYFTRFRIENGKPVEMSSYMSTRSNRNDPFGKPVHIPAVSGLIAEAPSVTSDGQKMYFHRINPATGKFTLYMLTKNKKNSETAAIKGYINIKNTNSKETWKLHDGQVIKVGDGLKKMYWGDPSVIKENGKYRMWFTGGDMKGLNHVRVYHATSIDGAKWKINTTPIVREGPKGSWDDERTETPSVIKVGNTYHMYYTGFKTGDAVSRFNIGHATSKDGLNWTKDPNNPIIRNHDDGNKWGLYYVAEPGAVYNPQDKLFYLYYGTAKYNPSYRGKNSDLQSTSAIVLATSKDGSKFTLFDQDGDGNQDAVFEPTNYYTTAKGYRGFSTPHVFIGADGMFHLFADAIYAKNGWKQAALLHAKSADGKSFTTASNDIFLRKNASWIAREVVGPTVIEDNGEYMMWFGGHGENFFKNFGISFARRAADDVVD